MTIKTLANPDDPNARDDEYLTIKTLNIPYIGFRRDQAHYDVAVRGEFVTSEIIPK